MVVRLCPSVFFLYAHAHDSKTIPPIYCIFMHKKEYTRGSVLL